MVDILRGGYDLKSVEYRGIWWIPGEKKNYRPGLLRYNTNDGTYLEIDGQLVGFEEDTTSIILGNTLDGMLVTLYDCFVVKSTMTFGGINSMKCFVNVFFEGVHFESIDDIKFLELSCHYSNLDEWAWMNGIDFDTKKYGAMEIKYNAPKSLKADIDENLSIEIYAQTTGFERNLVQKEIHIKQKIFVKIINKNIYSYEEHMKQMGKMQNFISLGVGEPVNILEIIGKTDKSKNEFMGRTIYNQVKIHLCFNYSIEDYKPIMPVMMKFNLRNIEDDFNEIITNWYSKASVLEPVMNLYFSTVYNSNMYLEQKFSSLIQAVESYHRLTKKNYVDDPDKFEEKKKSIIELTEDRYKDWISSRMNYGNEPSLRKRLKELTGDCWELIGKETSKDKKIFINKMCDTRNYFTHYDSSLVAKAAAGHELFEYCDALKIILEYHLLLETGFKKEQAYEKLSRRNRFITPSVPIE